MKKMNPGMMAIMAKKKPMKMADGGKGKMRSGGMAKKMAKGGGIEIKGKTKGKMIAMKKGGMGKAC
jgi:hypothetical protein